MSNQKTGRDRAIATLTNERIMGALKTVATKHLNAERIVKLVVGEFSRNPKLAECDPSSIVLCALSFSQLGLEPGGLLGHAYMIPRRNKRTGKTEANFQVGYKGKLVLNYRSRMFDYVTAEVVYRDDRFEYEYGTEPFLRHIPNPDSQARTDNDIIAAYAVARLKGAAFPIFKVITRDEILESRKQSQSANSGPWVTHFDQMARKTAIHRLEPYLPMSTEAATAHALEEKSERGDLSFADFGDVGEGIVAENGDDTQNGGTAGLKDKLGVAEPEPAADAA